MLYIFYRKRLGDSDNLEESAANCEYQGLELEVFSPRWFKFRSKRLKTSTTSVLWALLYLLVWRWQGKDFRQFLLYKGNRLLHCSTVLPKYYRFPFMSKRDIQIGPYWTVPEYRGLGLCPYVIGKISNYYQLQKEYAYILIPEANIASQKSAAKAGFQLYAYGFRSQGFLGKFVLQTHVQQ